MIYYTNLEEVIFQRHQTYDTDELIIISGYLGPNPVEQLDSLPFNTKVVYGMYPAHGIGVQLHNSLKSIQERSNKVNIYYSSLQVHSKCYIWMSNGNIIHALIGSANFSSNGLRTPYREVLTESDPSTYNELKNYIDSVLTDATLCSSIAENAAQATIRRQPDPLRSTDYCRMTLLDPRTSNTPNTSGINWGQNPENHTTPDDAYIPVRAEHIRTYPELFLPKANFSAISQGGRVQRHNDAIEILWDDGTIMNGLFEGNYDINGVNYPKQISSFPEKSTLGSYLRNRLGVASGAFVNTQDLINYGRTHIDISLLEEGIYYFDFSVPSQH